MPLPSRPRSAEFLVAARRGDREVHHGPGVDDAAPAGDGASGAADSPVTRPTLIRTVRTRPRTFRRSTHTRPARLVELPVGATEDRVLGGAAPGARSARRASRCTRPGLLAGAHRGPAHVDEVNLLHDHLVDVLLDAAAMGRARSNARGYRSPTPPGFVLVGTMNPEEGELRPAVAGPVRSPWRSRLAAIRLGVAGPRWLRRGMAYEVDPEALADHYADQRPGTGPTHPSGQNPCCSRWSCSDRELRP